MSDDFGAGAGRAQCTPIDHASHDESERYSNANAAMISPKELAMRWRAGLCRFACLALAAWAVFCVDAEARTGKIVLAVTGDEPMSDDLKQLVEDFEKAQPLSGDSLALLQGAQAVLARVNTALRSRGFYDARSTATI